MEIVSFNEIKSELISNIRRGMLIPIIGSGFTRGCNSFKGNVPSGEDYRRYMVEKITEEISLPASEKNNLEKETFSNISSIYHKVVPHTIQEKYLRKNFTKVSVEDNKKAFLSLNWPYIYTLNIDDGIENGSEYQQVIYANRPVNSTIFDCEKCVIKLHGDISEMLAYSDSHSEVFTQEQYILSLKKNQILLSKLQHDSRFLNLIFIGCSLDDEIDLLFSLVNAETEENQTARYICCVNKPSVLESFKYQKFGITHCILFDSFESIYEKLYSVGIEAQKINFDELKCYKSFLVKSTSSNYEDNKPYLLFGKSLIDKEHSIVLPHFFISREESTAIIDNFALYNLQLLIGSRCSGKSYILADVASKIKNKDVFYFETKDRLSDQAFKHLLQKENCVILADDTAFSNDQFEILLANLYLLEKNNLNIVVAVNKNNRELSSTLKLYEMQKKIDLSKISQIEVSNIFSTTELSKLNPLLTAIDVGIFNGKKTIIDNIINVSEKLVEINKYKKVIPKLRNIKELASLIALGVERKIYSEQAIKLDLYDELSIQRKVTEPMIDCESTWAFEKSFGDNSTIKYVLNAEYWLCKQLEDFASKEENHKLIVGAYQYIIAQIIAHEGSLDLLNGYKKTFYKEYILFDNINRLFSFNKAHGQKGMALIRVIYEGLNELLSVDPNYMHQRAKCYIKSSYYEKEPKNKLFYLEKAYRDANVAFQVFSHRYEECGNEKLIISIDHIIYTQALILCHQCDIGSYIDIDSNTAAVKLLHRALSSPYNSYSFAKIDAFNYQNVVKKIVCNTIANKKLVHPEAYEALQYLFKLIFEVE